MVARTTLLTLLGVTAGGLVVRAIPVVLTDFPVNDGGLFFTMVRAIQAAGWSLPAAIDWNGTELPFSYPPLAFYAAGLLESLGLDLLEVFRYLPLIASTLIVPAVFLLARTLLRSDIGGLVAAAAYALAPSSYVWLIQGGGVSRSPGLLLAVLTLWQTVLLVREPTRRRSVVVGLLAGLTMLTHPGAAVFSGVSAVLLWLFEGRNRRSLAHAEVAIGIALVVVAPWAILVASRYGLATLLDVPSNGPDTLATIVALMAGRFTGVAFTDPLSILGLAMAGLCLVRRRFLLPLWFVAATAMSYQYAMVPFSLLIAVAGIDLFALRASSAQLTGAGRYGPVLGIGLLVLFLLVEAGGSALAVLNPGAPLHALSAERRSAMAWVDANLDPEARVTVITDSVWSGDPDSEWFPVLAQRRSVATVQGSEWLGEAAFDDQVLVHRGLQRCVRPASVSCVRDWLLETPADYLFLPSGPLHGPNSAPACCADLRADLMADPGFTPVYDGPGATIFSVNERPLTRGSWPTGPSSFC